MDGPLDGPLDGLRLISAARNIRHTQSTKKGAIMPKIKKLVDESIVDVYRAEICLTHNNAAERIDIFEYATPLPVWLESRTEEVTITRICEYAGQANLRLLARKGSITHCEGDFRRRVVDQIVACAERDRWLGPQAWRSAPRGASSLGEAKTASRCAQTRYPHTTAKKANADLRAGIDRDAYSMQSTTQR